MQSVFCWQDAPKAPGPPPSELPLLLPPPASCRPPELDPPLPPLLEPLPDPPLDPPEPPLLLEPVVTPLLLPLPEDPELDDEDEVGCRTYGSPTPGSGALHPLVKM